ncbi:MAG TPA: PSD1 and planctomycete cytochrome C domain-containing protein [Planctomycetaceae bacterium]|nr:PSD1 and planctomycete cytochrome C domain-containing protein [Planctomycetaceae bacterium]
MRCAFRLTLVWLGCALSAFAGDAATAPTSDSRALNYERDVRPILAQRCFECHGPDTQESGLRLDQRESLLKGSKSGRPAVIPAKSADSRLIQVVAGIDKKVSMPPDGPRLAAAEIRTLRTWIDQGARWNPDAGKPPDSSLPSADFWSFKPVIAPIPPPTGRSWGDGPIDAFVLAKLRTAGLEPSPRADCRSLIRRLYGDVLGLPPTPEQISAFVADADPLAWSRLVDRVLANPHYGERWARHWLDVVRFAETDGFETNVERSDAYPYRDYVVRAFNDDKPYDRFVFEQLAGDAVGEDAATGFLVGGPCDKVKSPDVVLTRMQRQDELTDIINTTGTSFLALTLGCAKCHNHKFDPIPQRDFYAIQAVFAGVKHGERPLRDANEPDRTTRRSQIDERIADTLRELKALGMRPAVDALGNVEDIPPTIARRIRFTIRATNDGLEPCLDELEVFTRDARGSLQNVALASAGTSVAVSSSFPGSAFHKPEHVNDGRFGNERSWISNERGQGWVSVNFGRDYKICRIDWSRDRHGHYRDRLPVDYAIEAETAPGRWSRVAGSQGRLPLVRRGEPAEFTSGSLSSKQERRGADLLAALNRAQRERQKLDAASMVYAGQFEEPTPVHRLFRGDPGSPRESVAPGGIGVLGALEIPPATPERTRRIALAAWIVQPQNPLTARVVVNRLWHYHFGRGIVETPSDFGHNGGRPSHPKLLDWLAAELVRGNWSLKHVQRLILMSSAYQQSSAPRPNGLKVDANARLVWRFAPRRLEAEAIRDSMLAASGVLEERMGGPGFSAFQPNNNYVRVYRPKEEFGPPEWRRMVYMSKVRMEQDSVFGAFDCPDAGLIAPRRTQSTTAVQTLGLFNSRFTAQQADLLAARCRREVGDEQDRQVGRAFALVLGREPDGIEESAARKLTERHGFAALCRALFNANEFLFLP